MNYHFIAIGGSIMHNLALALHNEGHKVTGSDDEIYDPAHSFLSKAGLLPNKMGWHPARIHSNLDAILLGMHAKEDNPELKRAMELQLPVFSFPAFIYQQSQQQQRIVVAGSHGKTTITSMIMHVLRFYQRNINYLVGARLAGYDTMVRLNPDAEAIVLEGDEYLTSPLDRRPKFLHYHPNIAVLSGIAWDHINAFPTYDLYKEQFALFLDTLPSDGTLIYNTEDDAVRELVTTHAPDCQLVAYQPPSYNTDNSGTEVQVSAQSFALQIFGRHNLSNAAAAQEVCAFMGIQPTEFWQAMTTFEGAAKRLESMAESKTCALFRDFAHAPSKVKASVAAMRERYPDRKLTAVLELHTFSSLNPDFLPHYAHTLDQVDLPMVYLNPEAMEKKGQPLTPLQIQEAFQRKHLLVTSEIADIRQQLQQANWIDNNLLLMSSGNLGGLSMDEIGSFTHLTIKST